MQSKSSPGADEDAEDEPASPAVLSDLEKRDVINACWW